MTFVLNLPQLLEVYLLGAATVTTILMLTPLKGRIKMKDIDPVAVKQAIKKGQLEVDFAKQSYVVDGTLYHKRNILLRDTTTGDTVCIGEVE